MKSLALIPALLLCCAPLYAAGAEKNDALPPGAAVEKDPKYPPVVSYTLKNGLKLLILEKKFVPTVSFTMLFKVGNVDGQPGSEAAGGLGFFLGVVAVVISFFLFRQAQGMDHA